MSIRRYKEVRSRTAVQLFPPSLDEYVASDNPVRAIDAHVDMLDLWELGFGHANERSGSGHPPYDPAILLKLYMYGYQNRIRSSRRPAVPGRKPCRNNWKRVGKHRFRRLIRMPGC